MEIFFFFQAEDGIRDFHVTGVQTCALPIFGFNEPFSPRHGRTQLVTLDPVTRIDAASEFFGEENVPTQAITMGLGTIMDARKIILIALSEGKAAIIHQAVEEPINDRDRKST